YARALDGRQRIPLDLDGGRSLGRTRKRAAGNGSVIPAFRLFHRAERRGMVSLPVEPACQPLDRLVLRIASALDAEWIARILPYGVRHPSAFAFGAEYFHHPAKRDGPRAAMRGSTRPSSMASATSRAVSGASSTPFR